MSIREQIEPILMQLRKQSFPDSFAAALSAYLAGEISVDQLQPEINPLPAWHRHISLHWDWKPDSLDWEVMLRLVLLHGRIDLRHCVARILDSELAPKVIAALRERGMSEPALLDLLLQHQQRFHHKDGTLTPVGRLLLPYVAPQPPEAGWRRLLASIAPKAQESPWQLLLAAMQRRNASVVQWLELTTLLLEQSPPQIDRAWEFMQATGQSEHGELVALLLRADPARFTEHARAVAAIPHQHYDHCQVLETLVEQDPQRHVDLAVAAVRNPAMRKAFQMQRAALRLAVQHDPASRLPLLEEATLGAGTGLAGEALGLLKELPLEETRPLLQRIVAEGQLELAERALKQILLAREWPGQRAYTLELLAHRSKVVRDQAAAWLGGQGQAALDDLAPLLAHPGADTRLAAVEAAGRIGGPRAAELLRGRRDAERSAKVRRAIVDIVGAAGYAGGAASQEAALVAEAEATLRKVAPDLATQIDPAASALRWASGTPLPEAVVRFLIYRQSRAKPDRLDPQLAPALALIDRAGAGGLALALWEGWIARGADSQEARLLPLIGALADERLVPLLRKQIDSWAKANRRQLALAAIGTLAIQGGDLALSELDDLIQHAKSPRMRQAADRALADTAQRQGCSRAELLDRATPRLGFDARGERSLSYGARSLTARLRSDTTLELRDADGRGYASPPKPRATDDPALAAAAQAEWKWLRSETKRTMAQLLDRLERAMVHQRAWEAARWQSLFLDHPLLRIAARSLVWAIEKEETHNAQRTTQSSDLLFRPLEDGTLTNTEDEPVELPPGGRVRLAHPLLLDEPARAAWRQHLADYDVLQPFAQIDRPFVALPEEARALRRWNEQSEYVINSAKLAARSAKAGWQVGAPMDAGLSHTLWKYHPEVAIDAVLAVVGGVPAFSRHETRSGLGDLAFFRSPGPEQRGRRDYLSANDNGALELGEVPPALFSETAVALRAFAAEGEPDPEWIVLRG